MLILAFVFTIIWKLSCGMGLNCTFGMVSWNFGSIYTCTGSITIDIANMQTITVVNGLHQSGHTNADVLGLRIPYGGMEYFPVNIAQFFPNIKGLDFRFNSISYVNNQHLFPLPNLIDLGLQGNIISSLDSNLFSGLSMQWIYFYNNNITHVGHDFILPNRGLIAFQNNPCINIQASTPDAITALRIILLEKCPPNWLTNVNVQIQSLVNRTDGIEQSHSEIDGEVKSLINTVADLENRNLQLTNTVTDMQQSNVELTNEVRDLQKSKVELTNEVTDIHQSNVELTNEVTDLQQNNVELTNKMTELTNKVTDLQQSKVELTNEVTDLQQSNVELTNEVTDLQQSNVELTNMVTDLQQSKVEISNELTELQQNSLELTNEVTELTDEVTDLQLKNSQLETRIGFMDTRAGYLEVRVAILESIIESRLGLKIDEVISVNVNLDE